VGTGRFYDFFARRGPQVEALYARGASWLAGEPVAP
jgi:hypothetical protein